MIEDWKKLIENMNGGVKSLRQDAPNVMKAFSDMSRAAHGGEALDQTTKELTGLYAKKVITTSAKKWGWNPQEQPGGKIRLTRRF